MGFDQLPVCKAGGGSFPIAGKVPADPVAHEVLGLGKPAPERCCPASGLAILQEACET